MTDIQKPDATVKVSIQGQTFDIAFPTSGQLMDIAVMKAKLTDNQYGFLMFQNTQESVWATRLADAFSFFTITVPKMKNSMVVKSFYDLQLEDSLELIHAYDEIVSPWIEKWMAVIDARYQELKGEESDADSKRKLI